MPTQIATTPIVKGAEAAKILDEAKRRPTATTKLGADKLKAEFDGMVEKKTTGNSPRLR